MNATRSDIKTTVTNINIIENEESKFAFFEKTT